MELLITDIQRFSVNDGPGIRTTIFLKGCPLTCFWCHNPETQSAEPELMYFPSRCIGCEACSDACIRECLIFEKSGNIVNRHYNAKDCNLCGICVQNCPCDALVIAGKLYTPEQILNLVLPDKPYFDRSGGGVTFSGGEPLMQPVALCEAAGLLHDKGFHITVDTAGYAPYSNFEMILPHADLFLYDIKIIDAARHAAGTGEDNALILSNAEMLAASGVEMIVRVPVIPGFNDNENDIAAIADFAGRIGVERLDLLPFHNYAKNKYEALGREFPTAGYNNVPTVDLEIFRRAAERYIKKVIIESH